MEAIMPVSDPDGVLQVQFEDIDNRPDNEIAEQLCGFTAPTNSNKNVWAYWHTGFQTMPQWTQRNVIN